MKCNRTKYWHANLAATWIILMGALFATAQTVHAALIVDDSWVDAGRNNGADALDTDWWTSTSNQAIEVAAGSLGLVTGSSGRGIHGTFTPAALNVGDSLKATFTFTTPVTVGSGSAGLRIGFFDTTGKPGLAADLSASTGTPNHIYDNLPGYMMDLDVKTGTENIQFREHTMPITTGLLMSATGDYTNVASGGTTYTFAPNTSYTGVMMMTRTATGLDLSGSLSQGATLLSTFTTSDATASSSTYGMLAFHSNSNIFGSSGTPGAADNGIDFTNIRIEVVVPEPAAILLTVMSVALLSAGSASRRRSEH